jgi:hypothetical protein
MTKRAVSLLLSLVAIGGCSSSDSGTDATDGASGSSGVGGGAAGVGGTSSAAGKGGGTAGKAGSAGKGGSSAGSAGTGGSAGKGGGAGGTGGTSGGTAGKGGSSTAGSGGTGTAGTGTGGSGTAGSGGSGTAGTGGSGTAGTGGSGGGATGLPAGWLYTKGNGIFVSDGAGAGKPWMGRGVNMDDIFLCGYNNTLWMSAAEQTLTSMVDGLIKDWKPTFVRVSLGMASYPTVTSWTQNPAQYKTPMTNVINAIGKNPGVYVLIALRSEASMIGQDQVDGDPEATGLPSDATTTPDKNAFPTGTDATYEALVDTFADAPFVVFGLTNEPGGNKLSNKQIGDAMKHAVGVIRAREDKLGVPHHLVSVQGNGWTSDISFYAAAPLAFDNVVYEVHGYPPSTASYTYANLPVIIGEYGSLPDSAKFYADVEAKQIPNLAWDFESFSDCSPDLLQVNQSGTNLVPTAWGKTVQAYLLAH